MKEGGGDSLMHVYVWEHIVSLYYRTAQWMFTKLCKDEMLIALHMHKGVLAISAKADPGRGKNMSRGGPLLQATSSSDRKATLTNLIHSNDLQACGEKCRYIWFQFEVKFLTRF